MNGQKIKELKDKIVELELEDLMSSFSKFSYFKKAYISGRVVNVIHYYKILDVQKIPDYNVIEIKYEGITVRKSHPYKKDDFSIHKYVTTIRSHVLKQENLFKPDQAIEQEEYEKINQIYDLIENL